MMTIKQFRILVVLSFVLGILGGFSHLIFANPVLDQIIEYSHSLMPQWSDTKIHILTAVGVLAGLYFIYIFIGLMLFWNSARLLYLVGFIAFIPLYLALGITVISPIEQILLDASNVLAGMILALIYFSPIKQRFTEKSGSEEASEKEG